MTSPWTSRLSRRSVISGLMALLGVAIVGGGAWELRYLLHRRYPPTPYDDLLDQLGDRDSAARIGRAVLAKYSGFDPGVAAQRVRSQLEGKPFAQAIGKSVEDGDVLEIEGWVLPQPLVDVCALAAKTA